MSRSRLKVNPQTQGEQQLQVLQLDPQDEEILMQSSLYRNLSQLFQKVRTAVSDKFWHDFNDQLEQRYENLACTEGCQILFTNEKKYQNWRCIAVICQAAYLSLLLYDSIHQWQNFNDSQKYIFGECPWGIIFILLASIQLYASTPSYNMVHHKYKELRQLISAEPLIFGKYRELKFNRDHVFGKFNYACYQIFLVLFLITIEYFQKTFWDSVLYMVALDFLGQIQTNLYSQIFMWQYNYSSLSKFWDTHENLWFFRPFTLDSIYYFFWEIKKLNNIRYLPFQEKQKDSIINDLYIKIHDLYFDLEHEYGFRFALQDNTLLYKSFVRIKAFLLFLICIGVCIFSKYYQQMIYQMDSYSSNNSYIEDTNNNLILMPIFYILISIPIIVIQGAGYSLYNYKERSFFVLVNDYKYLCRENNINPKEFLFPFKRIRNYYYFRNFQKIILIGTLMVLQYFSESFTEAIFNLCALEFIGNLELNLYESEQDSHLLNRLKTMDFQQSNTWNLNHFTKIQYYNSLFKLGLDSKQLKNRQVSQSQLEQYLEQKLKDLFCEIMHEDGYQLALINIPLSLQKRYICFFIQQILLAAMMISNIYHWYELPLSSKWINGSYFPWGVLYVILTILIMRVQGVGRSEYNKAVIDYRQLKMVYIDICDDSKNPYQYEWNDQDLQAIELFNVFQERILSLCLIVIQFFSVNFYYAVLNVVALEFILNSDEHLLGKMFRQEGGIFKLYRNWKQYKIWNLKENNFEEVLRFFWEIPRN